MTLHTAGAPWLETLATGVADPARRIVSITPAVTEHGDGAVPRLDVSFRYVDMRGVESVGAGRIHLPPRLQAGAGQRLPLLAVVGYPLDEGRALRLARAGFVVADPVLPDEAWPHAHPVGRGLNLDLAWVHVARSLPCVDDARVVIQGLSAGGHKALLMAAESFPLCGVIADVPPVNYAHSVAYWMATQRLPRAPIPASMPQDRPWLTTGPVGEIVEVLVAALGEQSDVWFALSPVAHTHRITCRVSTVFSSADMLVPVDQVGRGLQRPFDATLFPPGFATDAGSLLPREVQRARLLEVLPSGDVELRIQPVPDDRFTVEQVLADPATPWRHFGVARSSRRWLVTVVDEGGVKPGNVHFEHAVLPDHDGLLAEWVAQPFDLAQLTLAKLEVLMSRCAGVEWLAPGWRHLDHPEAERADVVRGLSTYAAQPGGAERFRSLYAKLDPALRTLGDEAAALRALGG
jgi:hypothetical protein